MMKFKVIYNDEVIAMFSTHELATMFVAAYLRHNTDMSREAVHNVLANMYVKEVK